MQTGARERLVLLLAAWELIGFFVFADLVLLGAWRRFGATRAFLYTRSADLGCTSRSSCWCEHGTARYRRRSSWGHRGGRSGLFLLFARQEVAQRHLRWLQDAMACPRPSRRSCLGDAVAAGTILLIRVYPLLRRVLVAVGSSAADRARRRLCPSPGDLKRRSQPRPRASTG